MSDEQGERFHQYVNEIKRKYQGRWNFNVMALLLYVNKGTLKKIIGKEALMKKVYGNFITSILITLIMVEG